MSILPFKNNEVLQRYNRPAPRYTSYPTAAQFTPRFGVGDYRAALAQRGPAPLSLYVHIPFCASPCFYCGCTRIITRQPDVAARYLTALLDEIEKQAALFQVPSPIEQLHFGGGTPTFLDDDQLAELMQALRRHFPLSSSPQREFSIEIDPRTVSPDRIATLAALGFNRLSLGVQDFDPAVQQAVNREQSAADTLALIAAARRHGFSSVSVDLIYGLPLQTPASFAKTLQQVIAARPDRIAVYGYAHMPHLFTAQKKIRLADLPSAATKLELLQLTVRQLVSAGYVQIGMDHFALPEDGLAVAAADGSLHRNFQGYSTHAQLDLLGLGMSSISKIGDCYSQNEKTLDAYLRQIESGHLAVAQGLQLGGEDRLRAEVIEAIMCQGQVRFDALEHRHGLDFQQHFADSLAQLQPLAADGLVQLDDEAITVTPGGRLLLRNVAAAFDQYLAAPRPAQPRHAPAI